MVQNQMTSILSEDSPYMQQAEARGRAKSQARGWSSSTTGVKAVEAARIAAALPMAQQNAATWTKMYENEQTGDLARDMATHQFGMQKQLQNLNMSSQERQAYMGMMGSLGGMVLGQIAGLQQNPSITNQKQAMNNIWNTAKPFMTMAGDVFGYDLNLQKLLPK
jgi:hypothetical protein